MKVDCTGKAVDVDKIRQGRDVFEKHYKDKPSYIVMNYETAAELLRSCHYKVTPIEERRGYFCLGIPVAFNGGLKFGEVDIV